MNAELPPFKNGKQLLKTVYHRLCHNPFKYSSSGARKRDTNTVGVYADLILRSLFSPWSLDRAELKSSLLAVRSSATTLAPQSKILPAREPYNPWEHDYGNTGAGQRALQPMRTWLREYRGGAESPTAHENMITGIQGLGREPYNPWERNHAVVVVAAAAAAAAAATRLNKWSWEVGVSQSKPFVYTPPAEIRLLLTRRRERWIVEWSWP